MMCVLTMPAVGVTVEDPVTTLPADDAVAEARSDSDAAIDADCAAAKPARADTMTDLEKYIFTVFLQKAPNELGMQGLVKRVDRRLAL